MEIIKEDKHYFFFDELRGGAETLLDTFVRMSARNAVRQTATELRFADTLDIDDVPLEFWIDILYRQSESRISRADAEYIFNTMDTAQLRDYKKKLWTLSCACGKYEKHMKELWPLEKILEPPTVQSSSEAITS